MKTLCPNCYSNQVIPATIANPNFPQSLEPTLLSPAVLASLGVAVCKHLAVPPVYGMVIGTLTGVVLANLGNRMIPATSYYCRHCHQVFDTDNPRFTQTDMDITCPNRFV